MISFASGVAKEGYIPICYTITNFLIYKCNVYNTKMTIVMHFTRQMNPYIQKLYPDVNKLYVNSFENENNPKAIPVFQTKYEFKKEVIYISEISVFSTSSIT